MNIPLFTQLVKDPWKNNPRITEDRIDELISKYTQPKHTDQENPTAQIDNIILENNLKEALLMDEAEIINNLKPIVFTNEKYRKKLKLIILY